MFYNNGQHSLLVSAIAQQWSISMGVSAKEARIQGLCGLVHDGPEAYVSDIFGPLKDDLPDFTKVEDGVYSAIAKKFNVPDPIPELVDLADKAALVIELKRYRFTEPVIKVKSPDAMITMAWHIDSKIRTLKPGETYRAFLDRYLELTQ